MRRLKNVLLFFALGAVFFVSGCQKDLGFFDEASELSQLVIVFDDDVSWEDVQLNSPLGTTTVELFLVESSLIYNDEIVTEWLTPQGDVLNLRNADSYVDDLFTELSDLTDTLQIDLKHSTSEGFERHIRKLHFHGEKDELKQRLDLFDQKFSLHSYRMDEPPLFENNAGELLNPSLKSRSSIDWVPNIGIAQITQRSDGDRQIINVFAWNDVDPFGSYITETTVPTYEHDFALNNSPTSNLGPGTYLSRNQNAWGIPLYNAAYSNLPNAYIDTRFQDGNIVIYYTIGSANASLIEGGEIYYTWVIDDQGDADVDNASLYAQKGNLEVVPGCPWPATWCIFSDASEELVEGSNNWPIDVPGQVTWYEGLMA